MLNVMQMKNGELIKIADKMSGLITTDAKEIGFKEKRF